MEHQVLGRLVHVLIQRNVHSRYENLLKILFSCFYNFMNFSSSQAGIYRSQTIVIVSSFPLFKQRLIILKKLSYDNICIILYLLSNYNKNRLGSVLSTRHKIENRDPRILVFWNSYLRLPD